MISKSETVTDYQYSEALPHLCTVPHKKSTLWTRPTLLFVKIATPRRIHVTEMKCISHGLWACDFNMVWRLHALQSEYLCVVACNQKGPGYLPRECPSMQFVCESTKLKSRLWRTLTNKSRPTISQTCSTDDMSGERAGQGSSDTRRLWNKACTILAACGRASSCWNMACAVA